MRNDVRKGHIYLWERNQRHPEVGERESPSSGSTGKRGMLDGWHTGGSLLGRVQSNQELLELGSQ